jgi:3-oxoacyl-(acyl-carrier-protein) synthase
MACSPTGQLQSVAQSLLGSEFDAISSKVVGRVPRSGVDGLVSEGSSALELGLFEESQWVPPGDKRVQGGVPFISFALAATELALRDAGALVDTGARTVSECVAAKDLVPGDGLLLPVSLGGIHPLRTGVAIGCGIGSLREIGDAFGLERDGNLRKLSPFFVPRILVNMAAGNVGIRFGLRGPTHTVSTACATGANSIGDAFR